MGGSPGYETAPGATGSDRSRPSSVPAGRLGVIPRAAGRAVPALDIPESPVHLGGEAGCPVRAGRRHLAAGKRLRDAVRAAAGVVGVDIPVRLAVPERDEAVE